MNEIWIKDVPEESVSAFFDGLTKSAYMFYIGSSDGLGLSPNTANDKMTRNSYKIYKHLHEFYFKDISLVDSDEITYELSAHNMLEQLMVQMWTVCRVIDPKITQTVISNGQRDFFMRNISPETIISYFIGMSWLMKHDEPNRNEKLLKFYKFVREKMHISISDERILELMAFFIDEDRMTELRLRAFDILGITQRQREVLRKQNEQK